MTPTPATASPLGIRQWFRTLSRSGGRALILPLALPLAGGVLLLVQAYLIATILHRAVTEGVDLDALTTPFLLLAGVLGLRVALGAIADVAATRAGEAIKQSLRDALAVTLLARPSTWVAGRSSGALSTLFVEQVDALDGYFTKYLPALVQAAILPIAFAVVLAPVDWMVSLILVVTTPLIPLFMALAGWGAQAATQRQATALARLGGRFADRLRGLTTLKLFGRDAAEVEGVAAASEELRHRTMRVMRIAFLSSAVLEFFAALGVAGVALYVGLTYLGLVDLRGAAPLTLEAGLFCLLMAPDVYAPLRLLAAHYHDSAAAKAAANAIAGELGDLPLPEGPAVPSSRPAQAMPLQPAGLTLHNVSIATPDGRPVLVDADLMVAPRDKLAVMGPSGIGKSTLLEAIAGLRTFAGSIRIDGEDLHDMADETVRRRVAMLGQRPRLFAGSIADNIRFGRRDACDTAVRLAAQRACVTDFADALPEGLETRVGQDGLGLSGGEIHRIALARIYLRDPQLLLLDEPTAHLDAATEAKVLDGLLEFARGRTLIVATHSEAVAERLGRVVRVADGRILPGLRLVLVPEARRSAA